MSPSGTTTTVTGTTLGAGHEANTNRCNGVGRDVYYTLLNGAFGLDVVTKLCERLIAGGATTVGTLTGAALLASRPAEPVAGLSARLRRFGLSGGDDAHLPGALRRQRAGGEPGRGAARGPQPGVDRPVDIGQGEGHIAGGEEGDRRLSFSPPEAGSQ